MAKNPQEKGSRQKRFLIAIILFSLLISGIALFKRGLLDTYLRKSIETAASLQFDSDISIEELKVKAFAPSVFARGIVARNIGNTGAELKIAQAQVYFSPFPIFLGKIIVPKIIIRGVEFKSSADGIKNFKLRKIASSGKIKRGLIEIEVTRVGIDDLSFELDGKEGDFVKAVFSKVETDISRTKGIINYTGRLNFGYNSRSYEISDLSGKISITKQLGVLEDFSASNGRDLKVKVRGVFSPEFDLEGYVDADLKTFDIRLPRIGSLFGRISAPFSFKGAYSDPKVEINVDSSRAGFTNLPLEGFSAKVVASKKKVTLSAGRTSLAGGILKFSGQIDRNVVLESRFDLQAESLNLESLMRRVDFGLRPPKGYFSGRVALRVMDLEKLVLDADLDGQISSLAGSMSWRVLGDDIDLKYLFNEDLVLKGKLSCRGTDSLAVDFLTLSNPKLSISLKGRAGRRRGNLEYEMKAQTLDFISLGDKRISGGINSQGALGWNEDFLGGDGSLRAADLAVGEFEFGTMALSYRIDDNAIDITRMMVQKGQSSLKATASLGFERDYPLSLKMELEKYEVGNFLKVFIPKDNQLRNLSGAIDGTLDLEGPLDRLKGPVALSSENVLLSGKSLGSLTLESTFEDGTINISSLSFKRGSETILKGEGTYRFKSDSRLKFQGTSIESDLLDFLKLKKYFGEGYAFFDLLYEATNGNKKLSGRFDFRQPSGEAKGDILNLEFTTDFSRLNVEGKYRSGKVSYALDIGLLKDAESRIKLGSVDFDFVPFLSKFMTLNREKVRGSLTMDADMTAVLSRPSTYSGNVYIKELAVIKDDITVRSDSPTSLTIKQGKYRIDPLRLKGQDTDLVVEGNGEIDGQVDLSAKGHASLNMLSVFFEEITRGEGRIDLSAGIQGTFGDPIVLGSAKLYDGVLVIRDFPNMIQRINSDITFSQKKFLFDNMTGELGGGTFHGQGSMELGEWAGGIFFDVSLEIVRAHTLYPPSFPGVASGTMTFRGPYRVPTLSGDLEVETVRYSDPWDWRSNLISFGNKRSTIQIAKLPNINLDIRVRSESDRLEVRNNVADATFSGDVRITGDDKNVGLIGTIKLGRGKVNFLDNEFELTDGSVKFSEKDRVLAVFDITGKTTINDTEISLNLRGTSDKPEMFLASIPAKSETDIVSMLTLGVETGQLTSGGGAQSTLSQSIVTSLLTSGIQAGVEKTFRKSRIIDTFQVYPSFSEDTGTTELKVTIGKEVPYDMGIYYSTDVNNIGNNQEVKIKKGITDNLSVEGILQEKTDKKVDLGLDFEFKIDF